MSWSQGSHTRTLRNELICVKSRRDKALVASDMVPAKRGWKSSAPATSPQAAGGGTRCTLDGTFLKSLDTISHVHLWKEHFRCRGLTSVTFKWSNHVRSSTTSESHDLPAARHHERRGKQNNLLRIRRVSDFFLWIYF